LSFLPEQHHSNKITLQGVKITSKLMNDLGVTFDSKLNWLEQVSNTIKNQKNEFCAHRNIKCYLPTSVMQTLLISNYYSILCYKVEI
jgi:hypothetical protein